ncbi:hypothetical protein DPSP01_013376, partial [Paraphaeosphaeria sporulosa]
MSEDASRLKDALKSISPDDVLHNKWFKIIETRGQFPGLLRTIQVLPRPARDAPATAPHCDTGSGHSAVEEPKATPSSPPASLTEEQKSKVKAFAKKLVKSFDGNPAPENSHLKRWEVMKPTNNGVKRLTQVGQTIGMTTEPAVKRLNILFFAHTVDWFEPSEQGKAKGHDNKSTALKLVAESCKFNINRVRNTYRRRQPYLLLAESCGLTSLLAPAGITEIENFSENEIDAIPNHLSAGEILYLKSPDRCRSVAKTLLRGLEFHGWTRSELARVGRGGLIELIGNYVDLKNLTEDKIPYLEAVGTIRVKRYLPQGKGPKKTKRVRTNGPVGKGMLLAMDAHEGEGNTDILTSDPRIGEYCPQAEAPGHSLDFANPTSDTVNSPEN